MISRVVLIPFSVECQSSTSVVERRQLDRELDGAMESAASAAEILVKAGKLLNNLNELDIVLRKVESMLPAHGRALQRIITSYSWLLFATEKVKNCS